MARMCSKQNGEKTKRFLNLCYQIYNFIYSTYTMIIIKAIFMFIDTYIHMDATKDNIPLWHLYTE